jgi:hypothetical protein
MRRDAGGVDNLTGCVLHRTDGSHGLTDLDASDRVKLWRRVRATHEAWQRRGRA